MKIVGVIKERDSAETRVALVPEVIKKIISAGIEIIVEAGAGIKSGFHDEDYEKVGASIIADRAELFKRCDCLVAINAHQLADEAIEQKTIIGLFDPYFHADEIKTFFKKDATIVSLELIPRISRAQAMDVLSSQANIAGYVSVLLAAGKLTKVMPMMMTAAGTIKPAKVLIMGAGVAGLQAIATAKRLGAMVFAYDVRAAAKEQVESLGAKFIEIPISESGEGSGGYAKALSENAQKEQREKLARSAKDMDVVITTAQIPGKKAPLLLEKDVFSLMKPGSVVIDMAANSGGNVSGSVVNQWSDINGVWLYGADSLARFAPKDASFTFSKNIESLLELMLANADLVNDEIMDNALICHKGAWINKSFAQFIGQ